MEKDNKFNKKAILQYFEAKEYDKLNIFLKDMHSSEIYDFIKGWKLDKIAHFLLILKLEVSTQIFFKLIKDEKEEIIDFLDKKLFIEIVNKLFVDEIIDILDEILEENREKILNSLEKEKKEKIEKLLEFETNQVGFNMNVDYIKVKDKNTIHQARLNIKDQLNKKNLEIVGNVYIVDSQEKLLGYITPDVLLSKPDNANVKQFVKHIKPLNLKDSISKAEELFTKYDVTSVPVISKEDELVGVIFIDDLIKRFGDIEDIFLGASAVAPSEKKYLEQSVFEIFKSRISWIILLLFIGTLTQIVITGFQVIWSNNGVYNIGTDTSAEISAIVSLALATALSVSSSVNDSAGNAGSQVSATLVRAIALGEIGHNDFGRAFRKEFKVAFWIGFTIAIASFLRLFAVWGIMGFLDAQSIGESAAQAGKSSGWVWEWLVVIGLISSFTFFVSIIIGNIIGSILPIIAVRFKMDGAVISGPVQTTVVDVVTFTIYLSLTTAVFIPLNNSGVFPTDGVTSETLSVSSLSISNLTNILQNNYFIIC